jgi:hypothetical protein
MLPRDTPVARASSTLRSKASASAPATNRRRLPPYGDGLGQFYTVIQVRFTVQVTDGILDIAALDRGSGNRPENATIKGPAILGPLTARPNSHPPARIARTALDGGRLGLLVRSAGQSRPLSRWRNPRALRVLTGPRSTDNSAGLTRSGNRRGLEQANPLDLRSAVHSPCFDGPPRIAFNRSNTTFCVSGEKRL